MEFLQFILNFLTGGKQEELKELFSLLEQNDFNLQEVIKHLDFEKLAPILSAFTEDKKKDSFDFSKEPTYPLAPIAAVADRDIIYALNRYLADT